LHRGWQEPLHFPYEFISACLYVVQYQDTAGALFFPYAGIIPSSFSDELQSHFFGVEFHNALPS
jgi:hypothetical protein